MYNFKFNYLSRGQLVSLNVDKIFLPLLKILPCCEVFFGNLIFAIIARMLCGNHLNCLDGRTGNIMLLDKGLTRGVGTLTKN